MKKLGALFIIAILGLTLVLAANNNSKGNNSQIVQQKVQLKLAEKNITASLNMTNETENNESKLKVTLSNGRKAEIKIMPETASQKAIERLGALGFNITLKEVPVKNATGEELKPVYELDAEEQGRFLGLFKTNLKKQVQVDAETGEVIRVKKPWYSFLVA